MESEPSAAGARRATPQGQRARLVASASAGVATSDDGCSRPCAPVAVLRSARTYTYSVMCRMARRVFFIGYKIRVTLNRDCASSALWLSHSGRTPTPVSALRSAAPPQPAAFSPLYKT